MNISGIQTNQVPQNAFCPVNKGNATADSRSVSSEGKGLTGVSEPESGTPQIQAAGTGTSLSSLQEQLDGILVHYPPFFPIGRYQRLDLIKNVNHIQEEIEKSNIDPSLKKIYSREKLSKEATDLEISSSLGNLSQLRDTFTGKNQSTSDTAKTGLILNVKV